MTSPARELDPQEAAQVITERPVAHNSDMLDLVAFALQRRRALVVFPLLVSAVVFGIVLLLPLKYTTTVSFTPAAPDLPTSALSALAGQYGVNLGGDLTASPDFLASVINTRELLQPLVERSYLLDTPDGPSARTFVEILEVSAPDSGRTVAKALALLTDEILTVSINRRAGIVSVAVRTRWPELSHQIAQALVNALDEFMFESRKQRGTAETRFLSQRIDTARVEVTAAEDRLVSFLSRNRSFQSDPVLVAEEERLRRDVGLKSEVYGLLVQAFEQARTSAAKNTPSVVVVQPPRMALRFDRRHSVQKALAGYTVGLVACLIWIGVAAAAANARLRDPERIALVARLWREAIAWLPLRRQRST